MSKWGVQFGHKRVRKLMALLDLVPVYQKPRTTILRLKHKKYKYSLKNLTITRLSQVWRSKITHIPMRKGFLYLVAVMEVPMAAIGIRTTVCATRKVLSWKLYITMGEASPATDSRAMTNDFCVRALE